MTGGPISGPRRAHAKNGATQSDRHLRAKSNQATNKQHPGAFLPRSWRPAGRGARSSGRWRGPGGARQQSDRGAGRERVSGATKHNCETGVHHRRKWKKKKSRGGAVVGVAYHLPTVEQTVRHELPRADGSGAGHRGKVIPQCTLERGGSQEKPNG